ncbi:MAG TPA: nitroreductase/quinone reductase family protein [Ktedonobacterales bacterium]
MQTLERVRERERGGMTIRAPTPPPRAVMVPTNVVVRLLLRSPLHFLLSDDLMLLTYMGRTSGKRYTIPVAYIREGNVVTVFTYHAWWKNLLGSAPVVVEVKHRRFRATAEVIRDDETAITTALLAYLRVHPNAARGYNVPLDAKRQADPDAVQRAAQFVVMVRIRLALSAGQT